MVEKEDIENILERFSRRVKCRSESRIKNSIFFHALFAVLHELNYISEEHLENELNIKGSMSFRGFYQPYIVNIKIDLQEEL